MSPADGALHGDFRRVQGERRRLFGCERLPFIGDRRQWAPTPFAPIMAALSIPVTSKRPPPEQTA